MGANNRRPKTYSSWFVKENRDIMRWTVSSRMIHITTHWTYNMVPKDQCVRLLRPTGGVQMFCSCETYDTYVYSFIILLLNGGASSYKQTLEFMTSLIVAKRIRNHVLSFTPMQICKDTFNRLMCKKHLSGRHWTNTSNLVR